MSKKKIKVRLLNNLKRTIQWVVDKNEGELIENQTYKNDYLVLDKVSHKEVDLICLTVNNFLAGSNSKVRIINNFGLITMWLLK